MAIRLEDLSPSARRKVQSELAKRSVRTKYGAVKTQRGEITFDSRREAERFDELKLLLRSGKISNLKLQVQFTLQESYVTPEGERIRAIRYVADFVYDEPECVYHPEGERSLVWRTVVEDVKSKATKTPVYEMKRKMLKEKFGISIREV